MLKVNTNKLLDASKQSIGVRSEVRSVQADRSDLRKPCSENGRNLSGVWSDRTHYARKFVDSVGNFDQFLNPE
jgi:hypothetical protein